MATVKVRGVGGDGGDGGGGGGGGDGGGGAATARRFPIDLDKAERLRVPASAPLETGTWAVDGREGWVVTLPGRRPLATPAYAGGRLFVGGGYGSYEFYALDAATGSVLWQMKTSDDGPTAAVVEDDLVAFSTESCSVIVCRAETGELVWEQWLGDPLMSQPAVDSGRLYMVYPTGQRQPERPGVHPRDHWGHALLCASLATGEHLWEKPVSGDAITAPVVAAGRVYLTCLDGKSFCFDAAEGSKVWEEDNRGTSAPLVVGGRVIVTEKQDGACGGDEEQARQRAGIGASWERLRRRHSGSGAAYMEKMMALKRSAYLSRKKGGGSPLYGASSDMLDKAVGFGSSPAAAKLIAAEAHLGVGSVSGAWAYQGSRPAHAHGRLFNAQGRFVQCVEDAPDEGDVTGEPVWEGEAQGRVVEPDDQVFLPPALGRRESVYLAGTRGHVLVCRQADGAIESLWDTGRPLSAQPCLAGGMVYLGTMAGEIIALPAGEDADGWTMWGGNGGHNA